MKINYVVNILLLTGLLFAYGCGTSGKNFNEALYGNIVAGTTTHKEVQFMFGPPFKKGVQNGNPIWTYEYNYYNSLGNNITKDMTIVFNQRGVVQSHQMMSSQP